MWYNYNCVYLCRKSKTNKSICCKKYDKHDRSDERHTTVSKVNLREYKLIVAITRIQIKQDISETGGLGSLSLLCFVLSVSERPGQQPVDDDDDRHKETNPRLGVATMIGAPGSAILAQRPGSVASQTAPPL